MNVYQYIAFANRKGTSELVNSYGIQPANDPQSLAKQLASLVVVYKQNALDQIKRIHPDVMLFQKDIEDYKKQLESSYNFSNIDGQTLKNEISSIKDKVMSDTQKSTAVTDTTKSTRELLIIGGIIVIGLAIIYK